MPFFSFRAAPQGQRLAQGGFWQCMQRRGKESSRSSPSMVTVAHWIESQLYGVRRSRTSRLSSWDQSATFTRLGYILGKGFCGSGYLKSLTSRHASTHSSHPTHLRISISVANSSLSFGFAAAGRGTWLAQAAPAVARPVLRKDLLVKSVIRKAS